MIPRMKHLAGSMEVEQEPDPDAEEDMYDEEIEEEEPAHDAHAHDNHDKWTAEDWRQVKAMASDEVVDVDEWGQGQLIGPLIHIQNVGDQSTMGCKEESSIPPCVPTHGAVFPGQMGGIKMEVGTWWPYLSNNLA